VPPPQAVERQPVTLAAAVDYRWSPEPQVLGLLALLAGAYAWRMRDLRRSEAVRGRRDGVRTAAFAGGLVVLVVALVSPLDELGEERLFSIHMAQHLLLADVAPILLLLGISRAFLRPAVRRLRPIEQALGPLAHPAVALAVFVLTIWAWHLPAVYELALRHPVAHALEHAMFFWAGIAFWWFIIEPVPPRHRLTGAAAVAYIGTAKLLMGALGVIFAFSPNPIYDPYEHAPRTWGLSAVADLNVGGVTMMLEQSIVLVIFFAILFVRMLERSEKDQQRRERLEDAERLGA
jgi:putative membrane protein